MACRCRATHPSLSSFGGVDQIASVWTPIFCLWNLSLSCWLSGQYNPVTHIIMASTLEQLKKYTTVVADTGDFEGTSLPTTWKLTNRFSQHWIQLMRNLDFLQPLTSTSLLMLQPIPLSSWRLLWRSSMRQLSTMPWNSDRPMEGGNSFQTNV